MVVRREADLLPTTMEDAKRSLGRHIADSTRSDVRCSEDNRSNAQAVSGFDYPYGIPPPTYSYLGSSSRPRTLSGTRLTKLPPAQGSNADKEDHPQPKRLQRRKDLTDSIMDWYSMSRSGTHEVPQHSDIDSTRGSSEGDSDENAGVRRRNFRRSNASLDSDSENFSDGRDSRRGPPSEDDSEKEVLRRMDYKTRRKHIQRIRIQFNVSGTRLVISNTPLAS